MAKLGPAELVDYPLAQITAEGRYRKSCRNLDGLAKSIVEIGLLHPVVLTPEGRLVSGARRIGAYRLLGLETIPAIIVTTFAEARDLLLAERDENVERDAFLPEEAVDLGLALEALEKPKAEAREKAGVPSG